MSKSLSKLPDPLFGYKLFTSSRSDNYLKEIAELLSSGTTIKGQTRQRLIFIGAINSGKSSLINTIITSLCDPSKQKSRVQPFKNQKPLGKINKQLTVDDNQYCKLSFWKNAVDQQQQQAMGELYLHDTAGFAGGGEQETEEEYIKRIKNVPLLSPPSQTTLVYVIDAEDVLSCENKIDKEYQILKKFASSKSEWGFRSLKVVLTHSEKFHPKPEELFGKAESMKDLILKEGFQQLERRFLVENMMALNDINVLSTYYYHDDPIENFRLSKRNDEQDRKTLSWLKQVLSTTESPKSMQTNSEFPYSSFSSSFTGIDWKRIIQKTTSASESVEVPENFWIFEPENYDASKQEKITTPKLSDDPTLWIFPNDDDQT